MIVHLFHYRTVLNVVCLKLHKCIHLATIKDKIMQIAEWCWHCQRVTFCYF